MKPVIPRCYRYVWSGAVFAVAVTLYSLAGPAGFVLDDLPRIVWDEVFHGDRTFWNALSRVIAPEADAVEGGVLGRLVFLILSRAVGPSAPWFHGLSIVAHGLLATLYVLLISGLLATMEWNGGGADGAVSTCGRKSTAAGQAALIAAVVWSLHPALVTTVAYASRVSVVLAGHLTLIAAWCTAAGRMFLAGGRPLIGGISAVLGFIVAGAALAVPVQGPLAMLSVFFVDVWAARVSPPLRGRGRFVPHVVRWGALMVLLAVFLHAAGGIQRFPAWVMERGGLALASLPRYVTLVAVPHPLGYTVFHDGIRPEAWSVVAGSVFLVFGAWGLRTRAPAAIGIGWFFCGVFVAALLGHSRVIDESNLYIPSMGSALLVAEGYRRWQRRAPVQWVGRTVVAVAIPALLAGSTFVWARAWGDPYRLAVEFTRRSPGSYTAWINRATVEQERGDLDEARDSFERARTLAPRSLAALGNLFEIAADQGDEGAFWTYLNGYIAPLDAKETPNGSQVLGAYEWGRYLADAAGIPEGTEMITASLLSHKDETSVKNLLPRILELRGSALLEMGMYREAEAVLHEAIRTDPDLVDAALYLAASYSRRGLADEALAAVKRVRELPVDDRTRDFSALELSVLEDAIRNSTHVDDGVLTRYLEIIRQRVEARRDVQWERVEAFARYVEEKGDREGARKIRTMIPRSPARAEVEP